VKTTSSAAISSPLWNFTPWRSASSTVARRSPLQLSARPGTAFGGCPAGLHDSVSKMKGEGLRWCDWIARATAQPRRLCDLLHAMVMLGGGRLADGDPGKEGWRRRA